MEFTFKYAIGQKVKLEKILTLSQYRDSSLLALKGNTVTILDRGFQIVESSNALWRKCNYMENYHMDEFYYIEEDPCVTQSVYEKTRIPVECLVGDSKNETVSMDFTTKDGVKIVLGETKVYRGLIREYNDCLYTECNFTFCSFGKVNGLRYNWTYNNLYKNSSVKEIQIFREFLCYMKNPGETEPRKRQDACRYGEESWEYLNNNVFIYAHTPENYAELYVKSAYGEYTGSIFERERRNPFDEEKGYNGWERKQWLLHLGIFDEVKELYYKKQHQRYKMTREELEIEKFKMSAKAYVDKLSPSERAALKKLLE